MDKEVLRRLLAEGQSLERIAGRFSVHPSTVGYWIKKHGLAAVHAERHAPRGGISRDLLEELIETGATHRSIARELGLSVATVRHWLERYGLETYATKTRQESRDGRQNGRRTLERTCCEHGKTVFVLHGDGTYRCKQCRRAAVMKRRRAVRAALVQEAGGRCMVCGYDSYVGALQFHHLDPSQKKFGLSSRGFTRSIARMREEAKKCVLLCANCHAEVEGGVRVLSLEFRESLKAPPPGADYPA
jgi:transposase-like protein